MNDRELLEKAAKAAGIQVRWYDGDCLRVADKCNGFAGQWNPLTDDGAAFRLAVKLRMDIASFTESVRANAHDGDDCHEAYGPDPCAATRRAIVRAAAEMAEKFPTD